MPVRPPLCPSCGQPASEALAGPEHGWECRNEACPEFGQAVAADEQPAGFRVLEAERAFWRPSNQMRVLNTDLAKQLGAETLGARLWRLRPGEASTRHRHLAQVELYVVLEGRGRMRVAGRLLTLAPLSAVLVEPDTLRQVFNDTEADALWLVVGAPREQANTLEMTPERLAELYPDGPQALPPELGG